MIFVIICLITGYFWKKQRSAESPGSHKSFCVVCTTGMIADVVKHIAPDHVQVIGLMGPGVDPHLYRVKESDLHHLAHADIIFYNGLHLEGKMVDVFEQIDSAKVVAVGKAIDKKDLIESSFQGVYDPHIWHDVALWKSVACLIGNSLAQMDQEHASLYQENMQKYCKTLDDLIVFIQQQVERILPSQRILVTAHDAFQYFGRAYGFQVVGLQGISTDSDINTRDIQRLADYIEQHKIKAIFVESSIPQKNIQAVQRAVQARGWKVTIGPELFSDALGDESKQAHTYIGMIKHNVVSIVSALS